MIMAKLQQIFVATFISIFLGTLFLVPNSSEAAFPICASIRYAINDQPQAPGATVKIGSSPGTLQLLISDEQGSGGGSCDTPGQTTPWDYKVRLKKCLLDYDPREGDGCTDPTEIASGQFEYQRTWPQITHLNAPTPQEGYEYNYTLAILPWGASTAVYVYTSVKFSSTVNNPPPTGGTDYTPKNVVDCKVSDTSTKISWTTGSKVNSGLEWSLPGQPGKPQVANTALTDHSITIKNLTKGSTYGYVIYIPLPGETTVSAAKHKDDTYRQFKAGESTDATKCNPDGTPTDPNQTPPIVPLPPVDTSVKVTGVKDFDEVLGTLFNPLEDDFTSPGQIIVGFINIALLLAGILAVIFIIIGGFLMVTSAGNETRIKQGKQTLIWAVAGLILTLLSFSIVAIVQSIIT